MTSVLMSLLVNEWVIAALMSLIEVNEGLPVAFINLR